MKNFNVISKLPLGTEKSPAMKLKSEKTVLILGATKFRYNF
jgi:hypothetical protein